MFSAPKPVVFTLDIEGCPPDFQVVEFRAKEALNQPYEVKLELVSERRDIDLHSLHHRCAFLRFGPDGSGIHGQIHDIAEGDSGKRLIRYQMTLVPHLAYLAHCHDQRIFQNLSVPQIIARVLKDQGLPADTWRFQLSGKYPPRLYCVQYETDLHFVQRLCEEEGLHFHFEHSTSGHLLVFGDDQASFSRPDRSTAYRQPSGMVAQAPVVDQFTLQLHTRPTHVSRRDYDFEQPSVHLHCESKKPLLPHLEDYAFPGQFNHRDHGRQLTNRALERHRADCEVAKGRSDQCAMRSGHFFEMTGHPRAEHNDLWLLTAVEHVGLQPQVLEEEMPPAAAEEGFSQGYRNHFVAIPQDVMFRPALEHPKPRMTGNHPAVVTGPPGEEIYCDKFGRVKVRLFWDRNGQHDEHSSCWLRVATDWAHDRYGSVKIPRVGMEVWVGFTDGDPDKPVVIACLPNASTPLPLDLPAEKTRSVFRSQSIPGGGGYNELRIEDRKGAEEIALRAQRDFRQHVLNDEHLQVGNQRNVVVGNTSSHDLRGEEHHVTHGNRLTELKQHDHLRVHGDRHISVANQRLSASQQLHFSALQTITLEGGTYLGLAGGGQWLVMGPEGIFSSVPILQGGSPPVNLRAEPVMPGDRPLLKVDFDAAQQRRALLSTRTSRCLICEATA
ncbi:type VI secretion system tip protein VgrG [Pseudomonas sp. 14P_8.1_Bac3]|uniref:type VI secretion system Vgr family protein n=1 Tax=Pseudomonas sp. 14P_8.1_Bac3 TaxID=2971621 RepID=UPI0021C70F5F|nr:type VI secretion system tip protein VgrG [Pseudomonas sp. 14P_8.1_Bac3]MCU1761193.1 type VI secretion system tip protein VgrG [Pseudomonas sp. 14P_8.1_Bac3]